MRVEGRTVSLGRRGWRSTSPAPFPRRRDEHAPVGHSVPRQVLERRPRRRRTASSGPSSPSSAPSARSSASRSSLTVAVPVALLLEEAARVLEPESPSSGASTSTIRAVRAQRLQVPSLVAGEPPDPVDADRAVEVSAGPRRCRPRVERGDLVVSAEQGERSVGAAELQDAQRTFPGGSARASPLRCAPHGGRRAEPRWTGYHCGPRSSNPRASLLPALVHHRPARNMNVADQGSLSRGWQTPAVPRLSPSS